MARKNKTHSGSKKRFKISATGKVKRSHARASHLLGNKKPKRRRRLRSSATVVGLQAKNIKVLLGR